MDWWGYGYSWRFVNGRVGVMLDGLSEGTGIIASCQNACAVGMRAGIERGRMQLTTCNSYHGSRKPNVRPGIISGKGS